ncbi:PH domain-containing protein [[Clostridium] aminophilum]|uniref:PH domain-containing protein n=1 Tax=[Clostridium] aminophilum TaxID=1526 RepID=A0A1I6ISK9_9FIRM|nr:PH domain-containing protein [[Clostridium] aminophilum]SFR69726.1 PH domain-containing protein [[Clostridium] aminophilum]
MANISSGILGDASTFNLKEINTSSIRNEINMFLVDGEAVVQAFQTIRDQVVFTNKRIIVANVQGITGKKVSYISYPYSKVLYFGVETAGLLDIDSELLLTFANGTRLQFDFQSNVDIKQICAYISNCVL